MAEQNGWKPHEIQPKPLLPIPSELGAHYRRLQEFVGPSRPAGSRREVEASTAPFEWPSRADGSDPHRDASSRPLLGTINVIFATPGRTGSHPSRVMFVAQLSTEDNNSE